MEKISSIYLFKEKYLDEQNVEQDATVKLEIDHRMKQYSIVPFCGTITQGFKFEKSSHKWKMWKALLTAIHKAIDFANNEIEKP